MLQSLGRRIDANNDGRIDFSEFLVWFRQAVDSLSHFRAQGRDALVVVDDLDVHQAPFLLFVVHLCACVRVLYHTSCVHVLQHVCVRARVVHQLPRPHACA